jgi:hypothetical protein
MEKLRYVLDVAIHDDTSIGVFTSKVFERVCYDGIGPDGSMQDAKYDDRGIVSALFYFEDLNGVLEAHRRILRLNISDVAMVCYVVNEDGSDNEKQTLYLESEIVADAVEKLSKDAITLTGNSFHYGAMAATAMAASSLAVYQGIKLKELFDLIEAHYTRLTGTYTTTSSDKPRAKA